MSVQPSTDSPSAADAPNASAVLFEQYKLAVEMAAHMSTNRQEANKFFIALISAFGGLYTLFEKTRSLLAQSTWEAILPILAVCWCFVWWVTIRRYRRLNIAKWNVIEKLELKLPDAPFTLEKEELRKLAENIEEPLAPGSFGFTKIEGIMPILVGLMFLLLAARPLLDLLERTH
jgi:hypothetical protein